MVYVRYKSFVLVVMNQSRALRLKSLDWNKIERSWVPSPRLFEKKSE